MTTAALTDQQWITRCFDLARRGFGRVSPNPPVGAVLVHNNRILGEGYHAFFGGPHAEVEALKDVNDAERHLIPESVLYVSLEPCRVFGKTPPCTELILKEGIKDVRISTLDPNPKMAGQSVDLLRSQGIAVTTAILEEEGKELIKAFAKNIIHHQPYIILKWAQSKDLYIGKKENRVLISHPHTLLFSHSLRSSADGIMVGARTVMIDNPLLTTRNAPGKSPHRVIYDPGCRLNMDFRVFANDDCHIFYFSASQNEQITGNHISKFLLDDAASHANQILDILFANQIGILLVEGGSYLLSLFIKENLWDEAWIIKSENPLNEGISAPVLKGKLIHQMTSATDTIVGVQNE